MNKGEGDGTEVDEKRVMSEGFMFSRRFVLPIWRQTHLDTPSKQSRHGDSGRHWRTQGECKMINSLRCIGEPKRPGHLAEIHGFSEFLSFLLASRPHTRQTIARGHDGRRRVRPAEGSKRCSQVACGRCRQPVFLALLDAVGTGPPLEFSDLVVTYNQSSKIDKTVSSLNPDLSVDLYHHDLSDGLE